ncbi:sodium/hydrogen exchanger 9B2-like [Ptychodera flava]|uniref:sodium/hydrogen exchanger 9B2-like n=1 Tax=Ptychodera flava TaxID=63121 RepID=UPI00396A325E
MEISSVSEKCDHESKKNGGVKVCEEGNMNIVGEEGGDIHISAENIIVIQPQNVTRQPKRKRMCETCDRVCAPFLVKYHHIPGENDTLCYRLKYSLLCPPHGNFAISILYLSLVFVTWGTLWAITGEQALPGGSLFALFILWIAAVIGGVFASFIKLPPLLGMLIVGVALRNIPYINVAKDITPEWSIALRNVAFTVILIRAGLGLDASALKKLKVVCLCLASIPCLMECLTVAILGFLLLGFPWDWAFILGFVVASVSPAVVVPSMLSLQEKGLGMNKGIPTLLIASASVDNVLAITGFSVALGITFSTGSVVFTIFRGPIEVLVGICVGITFGLIMWFIPHANQESQNGYRSLLLFGSGLFALFGSSALGLPGSGALAVLTMSFVAAQRWKDEKTAVEDVMGLLWTFLQPFLFALIGGEILIENLHPNTIGLGIATLAVCSLVRMVVTFFVGIRSGLNKKERLFIALAWLPKATVQAAIGSIAYDTAREGNAGDEAINLGIQVLTIAVLSIIITAPIGAAAIALTGPRLLQQSEDPKYKKDKDQPGKQNEGNTEEVEESRAAMLTSETGI